MVWIFWKVVFLQEWGCELIWGDLLEFDSFDYVFEGMDVVIDVFISCFNDFCSIYEMDWEGKFNLFCVCE